MANPEESPMTHPVHDPTASTLDADTVQRPLDRSTAPAPDGRRGAEASSTIDDLAVYYGAVPRRARRDARRPPPRDHRVHRPVRLRQDHGAALPQPDERPHPDGAGSRDSCCYHGVDLYGAERVAERGAPAHRHGVPEAEPVPEEHLRQRRLRPAGQRREARRAELDDIVEQSRSGARRCGTR